MFMKAINKQKFWFSLLLTSYLLFSYHTFEGWWYALIGSFLIVIISTRIWPGDYLKILGLSVNIRTALKSVLSGILVAIASLLVMMLIGNRYSISIQYSNWKDYFHAIFYVLNEEMVLGALAIYYLVKLKKINPVIASLLLAVGFSLIHFVFYRWIFEDKATIQLLTLINLFLVGFVRNNLILRSGHIGYSWALHAGWIVIMLGSEHVYPDNHTRLDEAELFNLYLGSKEMLIVAILLTAGSIVEWIRASPGNTRH